MKPLFLLLLLLSIASCSFVSVGDPAEKPTVTEQEMIDEVLGDLTTRFSKLGYEQDFAEIPIFVVDEPKSGGDHIAGLCRFGARMILNRGLFEERMFDEGKISWLWWTLFHEIGHCYFYREHDDSVILSDIANVFVFNTKFDVEEKKTYVCNVDSTVMSTYVPNPIQMYPIELKDYYVREMMSYETPSLSVDEGKFKDLPFHTDRKEAEEDGFVNKDFKGDCPEESREQ